MKRPSERNTLLILIAISFLIRIVFLSSPSFYFDEAAQAHFVGQFVYKKISFWVSLGIYPPIFHWLSSIPVFLLGINEFSIRITAVIFGTLGVVLLYFFAKRLYNRKVAILSASLLAVMPLHVIYSRITNPDIVQAFFILAAIYLAESARDTKTTFLWISSAIAFALAFLTKYNAIVVWGLYWIFILMLSIKKDFLRELFLAIKVNLVSVFTITGVIVFTGGLSRLVYVVYSLFHWIAVQTGDINYPYYHYFAVLFSGLSPLLYFLLPVMIVYMLSRTYKKRDRNDYLSLFLVLAYFAIINFQTKKAAQYILLIAPFLAILFSRFFLFLAKTKRMKKFAPFLIIFSLLFCAGWSFFEISKINDYAVWKDAGKYIVNNYPKETRMHVARHNGQPFVYYAKRERKYVDYDLTIESLKKGDLVVLTWLPEDTTIKDNLPMNNNIWLYKIKYKFYSDDFFSYVKEKGKLMKTFDYRNKPVVRIYQIEEREERKEEVTDTKEEKRVLQEWEQNLIMLKIWEIGCKGWKKGNIIRKVGNIMLSPEQKKVISDMCY